MLSGQNPARWVRAGPMAWGPLLVLRALARLSPPQAVGDERSERFSGRVSPADAKRMPGRVRVHLVTLGGIEIRSWLEQPGAEGDCLFVRGSRVLDVEVEMHLLGSPMRPAGRNMIRRQLHADPPLSSGVDDAMPLVVLEDAPAENARPERTLGM